MGLRGMEKPFAVWYIQEGLQKAPLLPTGRPRTSLGVTFFEYLYK